MSITTSKLLIFSLDHNTPDKNRGNRNMKSVKIKSEFLISSLSEYSRTSCTYDVDGERIVGQSKFSATKVVRVFVVSVSGEN